MSEKEIKLKLDIQPQEKLDEEELENLFLTLKETLEGHNLTVELPERSSENDPLELPESKSKKVPRGDIVTAGSIILNLTTTGVLNALVTAIQIWIQQHYGRKFKIDIRKTSGGERTISIDSNYPPEKLKELIETLKIDRI